MTHLPPEMLLRGISSADELMADGGDKFFHFAAYAGLSFLFACWQWTRGASDRRVISLSLIVPGLYAVLDELLQIPVRRMADIMDCCADWGGVLAGFACFLLAKTLVGQFGGDASSAEV
ncbi:MAG: VanZ family protein [Planctomycetaceae bacterium]|nr:VanZ family protein [Planctomycetaceae bacterium]